MAQQNPIGRLQELAIRGSEPVARFDLKEAGGEPHAPTFVIEATFRNLSTTGIGASKKQAKNMAAQALLRLVESGAEESSPCTLVENTAVGNKVGELQEICSTQGYPSAWYEEREPTGPSHSRHFTIVCELESYQEVGEGATKKIAKREAAAKMVTRLLALSQEERDTLKIRDVKPKPVLTDEEEEEDSREKNEEEEDSREENVEASRPENSELSGPASSG